MSKAKQKLKKQIDDEIIIYSQNAKKYKPIITKTQFDKNNINLNLKQQDIYSGIRKNILSVIHGPAGTSKTFIACYTALALLADNKIDKIIITKPIQESGEHLGLLPGTIDDKIMPYKQSYYNTFIKILDKATIDKLFANGDIIFEPLAYMRGSTYDYSIMLLDECQNASLKQIMLWITRLGHNSKAIMMGDISQYDVKTKDSGYLAFINMMNGMDNLFEFEFKNEDIVRNKFLIQITNRYDKFRNK